MDMSRKTFTNPLLYFLKMRLGGWIVAKISPDHVSTGSRRACWDFVSVELFSVKALNNTCVCNYPYFERGNDTPVTAIVEDTVVANEEEVPRCKNDIKYIATQTFRFRCRLCTVILTHPHVNPGIVSKGEVCLLQFCTEVLAKKCAKGTTSRPRFFDRALFVSAHTGWIFFEGLNIKSLARGTERHSA